MNLATRAATAALVLLVCAGLPPASAAPTPAEVSTGITEPFFSFLVALVEDDSLGTWTGQDLMRYAEVRNVSRFPIADIVALTRREITVEERETRDRGRVRRRWELILEQDIERPMPYSILGYHPGRLLISKRLVMSEWQLGNLFLDLPDQEADDAWLDRDPWDEGWETAGQEPVRPTVNRVQISDVRVFRLDQGKVVLDADGFLDALLGKILDDSWTVGFVLARHDTKRVALAISVGRNDRRIYGEFDFDQDKILPHGRPLASALSGFCRRWTAPGPSSPNVPWSY